jgi:hypothetical protein
MAIPGTENVDTGFKDTDCGTLTVTSSGIKKANKPDCWK